MASNHPPSGFRDFINDDARYRLKLMKIISDVYQSFGFTPLETPALENLDLLQGRGGGEENEKLIFKVMKRGEKLTDALAQKSAAPTTVGDSAPAAMPIRPDNIENSLADLGLRFDLTLPLSRVIAARRGELHFPWKVFHIGPVWRAERPQKGRFREFLQCDVDIVGAKSNAAEIEVIQAVVTAIEKVGATGFELRLNDRRLVEALGEKFGWVGPKLTQFAILLDKRDKVSESEFLEQYKKLSESDEVPAEFLAMIHGKLSLQDFSSLHAAAAHELETMMATLKELDLPLEQILFDPSLVRGMGYYTGPVFELRHSSAGYSFGGGGRYDQLVGRLTGQSIPACGFSIGFERLVLLLAEKEQNANQDLPVLFVPVFDEKLRGRVLKVAQQVRTAAPKNLRVDVYPDQAKVKNQFKFAADAKYRWLLIIGEEEWNQQVFKLKDFQSGVETSVPAEELNGWVKKTFDNL